MNIENTSDKKINCITAKIKDGSQIVVCLDEEYVIQKEKLYKICDLIKKDEILTLADWEN